MNKLRKNIPLNTLEKALHLARMLTPAIAQKNGSVYKNYRLFSALASNEPEARAAFFIWRARGETIKEFLDA